MTAPKVYQRTPAWFAERRTGYGASDAPILVEGDEAAWVQLHGEKLGLVGPREPNEQMELGTRLEDTIAAMASERLGERLYRVNRILRHPDLPHVFASLDRRRKGGRPVELKRWGYRGDAWGPAGSDMVPTRILYQVQQQAAVTGADTIDLFVLFPDEFAQFTIGRDESIIRELLDLETAAWAYVERGEMPPWPGYSPKRIVLAADEIALDDELRDLVAEYDIAAGDEKRAKGFKDEARDRIRERLADVGAAKGIDVLGRRVSITHRPTDPAPVVAWELVAKAYRKWIEDFDRAMANGEEVVGLGIDLDTIESMFTTHPEPTRPLRVTIGKAANAA